MVGRLRRYPEQWHMLQKVFVEDLDPERLARARATGERGDAGGKPGDAAAVERR